MCMSGVLSSSTRGNLFGGVLYLAGRASAVKCSSEMTSGVHFKARRMKGVILFSSLSVRLKNENRICNPLVMNGPHAAMCRGER